MYSANTNSNITGLIANMDFYYFPSSGPCRSVQMTAVAVGVDLNLKYVDLMADDQLRPEFLKINPQRTVPTLVDGDFVLWESRAIMIYLVERYATDDALYPKNPQLRAVVNQRLFFDLGTLQHLFIDYYYPTNLEKQPADSDKFKRIEEAFGFMNKFLKKKVYAAGDRLTLADIALVTTVSNYEAAKFDISKYPNVDIWYNLMKNVIPGYDINQKGVGEYKKFLKKSELYSLTGKIVCLQA